MGRTVSIQFTDEQMTRLEREANRLGQSPVDAAARIIEESLRESEFPRIEFRDSAAGRQAYLRGTRLTAWMIAYIDRSYDGDIEQTSEHLEIPAPEVQSALAYAAAFPDEIAAAISDLDRTPEQLRELIPNLEVFSVNAPAR
ncbi:MAG TPA: hypothetical protein VFV93_03540 [Thermomicrobiales bacterium]|nr:hypothetical protein [Thermomicrobiales bacterium]